MPPDLGVHFTSHSAFRCVRGALERMLQTDNAYGGMLKESKRRRRRYFFALLQLGTSRIRDQPQLHFSGDAYKTQRLWI